MSSEAFAYVLLLGGALAVLHLGLSWRRRLPLAAFCAAGSAASVVLGLLLLRNVIGGQVDRSLFGGALWIVLLALGFFAVGAVAAVSWWGLVLASCRLVEWIQARRRERPS